MEKGNPFAPILTDLIFLERQKQKRPDFIRLLSVFEYNLSLITTMISLPTVLLAFENARQLGMKDGFNEILTQAPKLSKTNLGKKKPLSEDEIISAATSNGEKRFIELLKDPIVADPYLSILYAGIVFSWCSFEVLMKDLWQSSLNTGNHLLLKTTIQRLDKLDKSSNTSVMQGKYISLELLSKYDFNISDKIGTILIDRFDFNSLNGIKEAYKYVFPKSETINKTLENHELFQLESKRHLIVHSAGFIDDTYLKRSKLDKSKLGTKIQIKPSELVQYANNTIDISLKIIRAVDSLLSI